MEEQQQVTHEELESYEVLQEQRQQLQQQVSVLVCVYFFKICYICCGLLFQRRKHEEDQGKRP